MLLPLHIEIYRNIFNSVRLYYLLVEKEDKDKPKSGTPKRKQVQKSQESGKMLYILSVHYLSNLCSKVNDPCAIFFLIITNDTDSAKT